MQTIWFQALIYFTSLFTHICIFYYLLIVLCLLTCSIQFVYLYTYKNMHIYTFQVHVRKLVLVREFIYLHLYKIVYLFIYFSSCCLGSPGRDKTLSFSWFPVQSSSLDTFIEISCIFSTYCKYIYIYFSISKPLCTC